MKFITKIERIGEWLGPIDWNYDFNQHAWTKNKGGINPKNIDRGIEMLRKYEANPHNWVFSPCGFGSYPVTIVGMYDGWPFWKPMPAILYISWLGGEIAFFHDLNEGNFFQKKGTGQ